MDITWLELSKYKKIIILLLEQLLSNSLNKLSKLLEVDRKTLFVELKQFASFKLLSFSITTRSVYYKCYIRKISKM